MTRTGIAAGWVRRLYEIPITTALTNRILSGDQEAVREYRSKFWWFLALHKAFVDRMLREKNLDRLREAKDLGIPPAYIMAMCHMHAPMAWSAGKTPTASEAKRIVKKYATRDNFWKSCSRSWCSQCQKCLLTMRLLHSYQFFHARSLHPGLRDVSLSLIALQWKLSGRSLDAKTKMIHL